MDVLVAACDDGVIGKLVLVPLAVVLLVVVLVTLFLVARQDRMIFFPDRARRVEPSRFGLSAQPLSLRAADGTNLDGWWLLARGRVALLYFHGNAGNIGDRLERSKLLVDDLALDVFLVDYRGYGLSGGTPSEAGLYADGQAVYEAAASRGFPGERIVLFGESLGAAVALETARRKPCAGVILEAPFLSIPAMARHHYPWVPPLLLRFRFDNGEKIARLKVPKLIAQAERDEIVPPAQTRQLFSLAISPKSYFVIPRATHNETFSAGGRAYRDAWKRFLDEAVPNL